VLFEVVEGLVELFTTGVLPLVVVELFTTGVLPLAVVFCGGDWLLVLLLTASVAGATPCPFDPPVTGFVVLYVPLESPVTGLVVL
jgi:hypothetical protein